MDQKPWRTSSLKETSLAITTTRCKITMPWTLSKAMDTQKKYPQPKKMNIHNRKKKEFGTFCWPCYVSTLVKEVICLYKCKHPNISIIIRMKSSSKYWSQQNIYLFFISSIFLHLEGVAQTCPQPACTTKINKEIKNILPYQIYS